MAWLPVIVWAAFIFWLSGDRFSDPVTAGWLSRSWLLASLGLSTAVLETGNLILRKCAHFVEYAVLGLLAWRASARSWPERRAGVWLMVAVAVATVTASLDEIRQAVMTAERSGKTADVALDATGGAAGALLAAARRRRRQRRQP